jgi:hypothetical protein
MLIQESRSALFGNGGRSSFLSTRVAENGSRNSAIFVWWLSQSNYCWWSRLFLALITQTALHRAFSLTSAVVKSGWSGFPPMLEPTKTTKSIDNFSVFVDSLFDFHATPT